MIIPDENIVSLSRRLSSTNKRSRDPSIAVLFFFYSEPYNSRMLRHMFYIACIRDAIISQAKLKVFASTNISTL